MKSKVLIASAVLLSASVVAAAPAQAHDDHWPLYALTGLALVGAYTSHHHNHGHSGHHHGHYAPRRYSSSYGYSSGHRHGSSRGHGPSHGHGPGAQPRHRGRHGK